MHLTPQKLNRLFQFGNATSEYTIIGALIAVACGLGLMALGNSIQGHFWGMNQAMTANSARSTLALAGPSPSGLPAGNNGSTTPKSGTSATPSSDNTGVSNPSQVIKSLQVAGVNGATQELLATLEQRARALKSNGDINEEQYNLLMQLANHGHDLAASQKALEDALRQGRSTVLYNGKTYQLTEFMSMHGFDQDISQSDIWALDPFDTSSPVFKSFAESYQQIKESGVFLDSNVKQQVSELVLQIASMEDAFSWAMDDVMNSGGASSLSQNYNLIMSETIKNFQTNTQGAPISEPVESVATASQFTDQSSAKICSTGGGTDTGTHCNN